MHAFLSLLLDSFTWGNRKSKVRVFLAVAHTPNSMSWKCLRQWKIGNRFPPPEEFCQLASYFPRQRLLLESRCSPCLCIYTPSNPLTGDWLKWHYPVWCTLTSHGLTASTFWITFERWRKLAEASGDDYQGFCYAVSLWGRYVCVCVCACGLKYGISGRAFPAQSNTCFLQIGVKSYH